VDRDLLSHIPVVLTVAQRGGFASAAAALNMSPSAVSHAVRAVEARPGPALATIQESVERVRSAKGQVAGVVRLNAPRLALPMAITPAIVAMSGLYPDLTIEVTLDEGLIEAADAVDGGGVGET
jgi:DNA-binding transcriptional LysR family regulator